LGTATTAAKTFNRKSENLRSQPLASLPDGKPLLLFERFGGRFNNQIFQFVSALQHAHLLGRKLVVPPASRGVDWDGMMSPELKLWDLEHLHSKYDVDFYDSRKYPPDKFPGFLASECQNGWAWKVPPGCRVTSGDRLQLLNRRDDAAWFKKYSFASCPVLNLGGRHGLMFCGQHYRFCGDAASQRVAYRIYPHLLPHPDLLSLPMVRAMQAQAPFALSVHSRTAGGANVGNGDTSICSKGVSTVLSKHAPGCPLARFARACAIWEQGAIADMAALTSPLVTTKSFFLAHDAVHDWSGDVRAITMPTFPTSYFDMSNLSTAGYRPEVGAQHHPSVSDAAQIATLLLDIHFLTQSEFFIGNLYSTLSFNVCIRRGEENRDKSNICAVLLHPESPHGVCVGERRKRLLHVVHA